MFLATIGGQQIMPRILRPNSAAAPGVCAFARSDVPRTLLEVSRATASHRDLESLLRDLADVLQRVAPFDVLRLVLHDPERDMMRLHTLASVQPVRTTVLELPTSESPSGVAMRTQLPVVVPDIDRETRFPAVDDLLRAEGMRSFCAIPLISPLRRLGALHFASHLPDAFAAADVEFLQKLGGQVALAVDNTLHHEAAQRAQDELARKGERLRLLLEVNNALVSNLESRALFSAISTCLRRVVAHDYTSLAVHDAPRNAFLPLKSNYADGLARAKRENGVSKEHDRSHGHRTFQANLRTGGENAVIAKPTEDDVAHHDRPSGQEIRP